MKKYSLLVFDWDGTLVDSKGLLIESLQKTAVYFNYPIPEITTIRKHFGLTIEEMLKNLFPKEDQPELIAKFHNYFSKENIAINLFPGAIEILNYLKQSGFILAIATNATRIKLDASLDMARIKNLFAATCCPEDAAPKPAPEMLLTLIEKLAFMPQDTLMIGDTTVDMQFANNAEVDALAVCYGNHRKDQLAAFNPIDFIGDIRELKNILQ
ncbi:MAG: hypothetical protein ACD_21C00332G0003 [uncultured bacterium]|nr:MAG: hypothetical protein ACD_21C00332G0003 [uncultured bacterium]